MTTYQPDCRPQSTNCGIGSEELPGLSIVCRRYGGFQSPSFCADWSFATTLRILQYILTHCAFGGPTNCRVGSCYRLTGQLVPPLHTTGLGTLSDCPIQGLIFHFNREGWAPLFWLAWRNFLHEPVALCDLEADTTTTHRGPIHHGWQLLTVFSFVWHWIHFSWWQILSFWIGLALLLAKGALELHWLSSHFCIFPESALRRVLRKKAAVILDLHSFTSADLDLHTFTSADLDLHTLTPADLDLHTRTPADLDLHTFTSADLDLHSFTSADLDLHTLTPADLDLHTLTPADLDLHTFTSADLDLHTLTSADLDLHTC